MESQDMAEVRPLFGESVDTENAPHLEVEWHVTQWSPAERMRLLRILFGPEERQEDVAA